MTLPEPGWGTTGFRGPKAFGFRRMVITSGEKRIMADKKVYFRK
jgi:hypothetical protein